jgi:hypothetical protein
MQKGADALQMRSYVLLERSPRMVVRKRKSKAPAGRINNDSQLVVRLPGSLVGRVDAFAERMRDELPGVRFARAEAVRVLLTRALDQLRARSVR